MPFSSAAPKYHEMDYGLWTVLNIWSIVVSLLRFLLTFGTRNVCLQRPTDWTIWRQNLVSFPKRNWINWIVHRNLFIYLSLGISFTCFYDIRSTIGIQLKTVWLTSIMNSSHLINLSIYNKISQIQRNANQIQLKLKCFNIYRNIFQWNNASGLFIGRIFKIVQTIIVENEPPSFPWFVSV